MKVGSLLQRATCKEMYCLRVARLFLLVSCSVAAWGQQNQPGKISVVGGTVPHYQAITGKERLNWFVFGTVGPQSLAGGVISSAWGTLFNKPTEYGPHWEGFGKRYAMRLSGVSTGNAIEAGFGALWG